MASSSTGSGLREAGWGLRRGQEGRQAQERRTGETRGVQVFRIASGEKGNTRWRNDASDRWRLPVVGLGCNNFGWRIDEQATAAVVHAALDAGINFFDTADIYDNGTSEEFLGRALGTAAPGSGGRDQVRHEDGRAAARRQAGLRPPGRRRQPAPAGDRLHRPLPVAPARSRDADRGHARRDGGSRARRQSTGDRLLELLRANSYAPCRGRFASVQNHYSLLHREPEDDVIPECVRQGIAFIPYFPLESGLLTGKYRAGQPPPPGSRGDAGWGPKVFTRAESASGSSGSASLPSSAATRCSNWRCPGSRTSPP